MRNIHIEIFSPKSVQTNRFRAFLILYYSYKSEFISSLLW